MNNFLEGYSHEDHSSRRWRAQRSVWFQIKGTTYMSNNQTPKLLPTVDLDSIATALDLKTVAGKVFLRIALENVVLMDKKQQDYGSHNIRKGGIFGCILRASDKFERLFNLFNNRRRVAVNESIRDSLRDISNYMIIAVMLDNKEWPSE